MTKLVDQLKLGLDAPICLTWELTYACNLECVHCLSSSGRRDPRELTTDEAKAVFAAKKNLRLLTTGGLPDPAAAGMTIRQVAGGYLTQDRDNGVLTIIVQAVGKTTKLLCDIPEGDEIKDILKHKRKILAICRHGSRQWDFFSTL